jgi:ketosteroid isomerase-like protein
LAAGSSNGILAGVSRDDVEHLRRVMEHFKRTGEPFWEYLDPEFEIHDHDIPDAGTYRGRDGWREWIAHFGEAWEDFGFEPQEYIDAGDGKVVLMARMWARGRGSGVSVEHVDGTVWTIRDGKTVRLDYYGSRVEALEAAGLS